MSDKGLELGLIVMVVLNFAFDMVSFWILQRSTMRVNEMAIAVTRIDRDKDLITRIGHVEKFARTFCIDDKLQACGKLGTVKK